MRKKIGFILVFLLLAMGASGVFAGEIELKIYPTKKISIAFKDEPSVELMFASFQGFEKGQVELRADCQGDVFVSGKTCYSFNGFKSALQNGKVKEYPTDSHKKLNYTKSNDRLIIKRYDKNTKDPVEIEIPDEEAKRFLSYLSRDTQDELSDCADFCWEIFFKEACYKKNFFDWWRDNGGPDDGCDCLKFLKEETDEKSLKPGDGVALFSGKFGKSMKIEHWVIALGDECYVSKWGAGGAICVHKMKPALDFWGCTGFCRIVCYEQVPENFAPEPVIDESIIENMG